jgi:hypothetical protein
VLSSRLNNNPDNPEIKEENNINTKNKKGSTMKGVGARDDY